MPAFALPSFYDGRIRINLEGREARGVVTLGRYEATCGELERLLLECQTPRTGEPTVETIERGTARDPLPGAESALRVSPRTKTPSRMSRSKKRKQGVGELALDLDILEKTSKDLGV